MTTKTTKRQDFTSIVEILRQANRPELVERMENELKLLDRKNANKINKPSEADIKLTAQVLDIITNSNKAMTVTEIMFAVNDPTISNQKMSSICKKLVETGKIEKFKEKRVSYYQVKN